MPMPLVAPMPFLPSDVRLGAPLLAQEASYLAASAKMSSLSINSTAHPYNCMYIQHITAIAG
jgi:hypothetical protein